MSWALDKISAPGWDKPKVFETKQELAKAFWDCICGSCRDEVREACTDGEDTFTPTADDIWNTPCGCEYDVEEVIDANDY